MNNLIKIDQEHCVEDSLVTIILEPEYYGIEDVRSQRDMVIEKLIGMANEQAESPFSSEQVAKIYDRIMSGDIEQTLRDYFTRNLAYYHSASTTLYYRISDITHQWYLLQYRKRSKEAVQTVKALRRPRKLFEDLMDCLEGTMLDLKDLSKLFTTNKPHKKPL